MSNSKKEVKTCKQCVNSMSNGGECYEGQVWDGYYAWGTPAFKDFIDSIPHVEEHFPSKSDENEVFCPSWEEKKV